MGQSKIEWTTRAWNMLAGCTRVSEACEACWAERQESRRAAMGRTPWTQAMRQLTDGSWRWSNQVLPVPQALIEPYKWSDPSAVFVCSRADLFHEDVPDSYIRRVFNTMIDPALPAKHWWQTLTKRTDRLAKLGPSLPWGDDIWAGVTIELEKYMHRLDHLRECGARNIWLSLEPLLGPMGKLDLTGVGWVVIGGMSGSGGSPKHRMEYRWVGDLVDRCEANDIPVFFKQWGHSAYNPLTIEGEAADPTARRKGVEGAKGGCQLDGRVYHQVPAAYERFFHTQTNQETATCR